MNAVEGKALELVEMELAAANEKHPPFVSQHEWFTIVNNEIKKLEEASAYTRYTFWDLKMEIEDGHNFGAISDVFANAINAACAAIKVAGMCKKFKRLEGKK